MFVEEIGIATRDMAHILGTRFHGRVATDMESLSDSSNDFGRLKAVRPKVVVYPEDKCDIQRVFELANRFDLNVSTGGTTLSHGGQSMNHYQGIAMKTAAMNRIIEINKDEQWALVQAGMLWHELVKATLSYGLTPPALTTVLFTSMGGTHSVGGFSRTSFHTGTQAENCLEFEIITPAGEAIFCSEHENSELFRYVLSGLGQLGVITKIKVKLREFKPITRRFTLVYAHLETMLQDLSAIIERRMFDSVVAGAQRRVLFNGRRPSTPYLYVLKLELELDTIDLVESSSALKDLQFYHLAGTEDLRTENALLYRNKAPERRSGFIWPGYHFMLPWHRAAEFIDRNLEPIAIDANVTAGHYIMAGCSASHNLPLFRVPDGTHFVMFGLTHELPAVRKQACVEIMNSMVDSVLNMGGKLYLIGSESLKKEQWHIQLGPHYQKLASLKRTYDPNAILNHGYVQYEEER